MFKKWHWIYGLLIISAISNPALGGLYKWYDSKGQVHYTDNPPPDKESQAINPETALPTGVEKEKSALDKQVEEFNKRRDERLKQEEEAKKKTELEAQRKKNCEILKKNLQLYLTRNRVTTTKDGEKVVMPYEERVKEIEAAQKKIDEECAGF
jgi:hypothetical protein